MSLINKVLRDLEAQRAATEDTRAQQSPLVDAGLHPVRRLRPLLSRTQLVRIGLLLVISAATAAFAWLQWGHIIFRSDKSARVAPAPVVVSPPPEAKPSAAPAPIAKPQHTDVLTAVPRDAKPAMVQAKPVEPPAAKPSPVPVVSVAPAKAPAAAAPAQDVVVRKPSAESTRPEMEAVKTAEPIVTTKAQPGGLSPAPLASVPSAKAAPPAARKPEAAPAKEEEPDAVAEEPEETPAPKTPAGKKVLEKKLKPLTPEERAESEYRLAAGALQQKRTGEAESRLRTALQAQPSHAKARELLAGLALQGGRWREAQSLLEQGVALNPNHYPFAQLLARSYVDHGQEKKALELLEKSRAAADGDPEYLAFLATLYQRAGRQDDAARNFSEALKSRPQEGRWWLGFAISLEAIEKWKESAEAYQRAAASGSLDKQLLQYSQQRLAIVKNK